MGGKKKHSHCIKTAEFVMNQSLSLINQQIRRPVVFSRRLHARRINKCIAMESRCLAMRRDCANRQIKSVLPELIKDQFRRAPRRLSREFFLRGGHPDAPLQASDTDWHERDPVADTAAYLLSYQRQPDKGI